jgi:hypothetical protein
MKVTKLLCALLLVATMPRPAAAYLDLSSEVRGQTVALKWARSPVRWFATERGVPGVSASQFQTTIARAFAIWEDVPTATIAFQFVGFTSGEPFDDDNLTTLGFQMHPEMERVLGATGFVVDEITGEIVESDVFFNSAFSWSVSATGDPAAYDLQSVATHEIGHVLGLGHSALGETELRPEGGRRVIASGAVMFPISFGRGRIADRELQPDDVAGVSDLYPETTFRAETGGIRGRVTRNGRPVFGAHIVAFNPGVGDLIGGFSLNDEGEFQIAGLPPGAYVVRVEPLDDGDVESFFDLPAVDVDFGVTFAPQLVIVPAGGVGQRIDVALRPK